MLATKFIYKLSHSLGMPTRVPIKFSTRVPGTQYLNLGTGPYELVLNFKNLVADDEHWERAAIDLLSPD
eukprot:SAG31_NODE_1313_length_8853_cov_60.435458_10_plen_69_part_00